MSQTSDSVINKYIFLTYRLHHWTNRHLLQAGIIELGYLAMQRVFKAMVMLAPAAIWLLSSAGTGKVGLLLQLVLVPIMLLYLIVVLHLIVADNDGNLQIMYVILLRIFEPEVAYRILACQELNESLLDTNRFWLVTIMTDGKIRVGIRRSEIYELE